MRSRVTPQSPHCDRPVAKLVLQFDELAKRRERVPGLETDMDLANAMGVHPSQVSRVLRGGTEPGIRFVAGLLDVFGMKAFPRLFALDVSRSNVRGETR